MIDRNEIYFGDARTLAAGIDDGSVDLIFTDPPYSKKYLHLYDWLAIFAERTLKPEGFLLAYTGQIWKDKIFKSLGGLFYFYDYILYSPNASPIIWPRKTLARHKSILCYRLKGSSALPNTNVLSLYENDKKKKFGDKRYHKWGQTEQEPRYFIDVFSREGDLIVDPFLGGGTTAIVARAMSRNWIGFENDPEAYKAARDRLDGKEPLPGRVEQLELIPGD